MVILESKTRLGSPQSLEWHQWPDVSYPDMYNYLIETTSEYTHEQLKAYKSLEGYNYLANGWINSISVIKSDGKSNCFIFTASVKHSQSLSATPLKLWIAIKSDGTILCAHCTCMAGLGEVCSHVAAVLFAAYENTKVKEQHSSTSLPCSWLPPSFRSVDYAPICNIDFTTPKQKRKLSVDGDEESVSSKPSYKVSKLTDEDIDAHYENLSRLKMNPVLLSFVDEYSDSFVPLYERGVLPKPLSLLYQDKNFTCFTNLLKVCEQVYQHTTITAEQVKMVEEKTREQSNSKLWFQQRVGRITASKLRNVLHTSISNPSKSLLTSICYPEMVRYQSKACLYGCKHEDDARKAYTEVMSTRHRSFSVARSGLVLDVTSIHWSQPRWFSAMLLLWKGYTRN